MFLILATGRRRLRRRRKSYEITFNSTSRDLTRVASTERSNLRRRTVKTVFNRQAVSMHGSILCGHILKLKVAQIFPKVDKNVAKEVLIGKGTFSK